MNAVLVVLISMILSATKIGAVTALKPTTTFL